MPPLPSKSRRLVRTGRAFNIIALTACVPSRTLVMKGPSSQSTEVLFGGRAPKIKCAGAVHPRVVGTAAIASALPRFDSSLPRGLDVQTFGHGYVPRIALAPQQTPLLVYVDTTYQPQRLVGYLVP